MIVVTHEDECIQKHAHLQIYDPVLRGVRGRSWVGGTWVVCSMMAGLEDLQLPNVLRLHISGFSHKSSDLSALRQTRAHSIATITS